MQDDTPARVSEQTPLTVENLMMAYYSGSVINGMRIVDVQVEIAPEKLPASSPGTIQRVQDGMLITFKVKRIGSNL
jgi:hypothetical protein